MIHPPDVIGKYAPDALVGPVGTGGGGGGKKKKKGKKGEAAPAAAAAGGAVAAAAPAKKAPAGPWYAGDNGKRKVAFLGALGTSVTGACVMSHWPLGVCGMLILSWWAY